MNLLREFIREILSEDAAADEQSHFVPAGHEEVSYISPPRDFYEKTGINMIQEYVLPEEFSSPEALQVYILREEPSEPEAATDFYSDLVDKLVSLNPKLSVIRGLGAPEERHLLPDQKLSEVYPWHLKDIVMGVASEMRVADIRYYLEDNPMSWEVADIIKQFTDETGVRPQWVISPETAATVGIRPGAGGQTIKDQS